MKRLLGGYLILNLCMISMTLGTSQVSITNEEALEQLRNLRDHIQKDYDFKRPLNNQLKPIQLRIRDQKNGEKQESVVWGNLAIFDNALKFKIEALVDSVSMKALQIEVVFEEKTDDDGNKYFDIKTAKYLYTESAIIYEGITKLENIEDKDGHKRYIEGALSVGTQEGLTITYGKWALSGTHLLFVVAGNFVDEATLSIYAVAENMPQWIKDKIYPVANENIEIKTISAYGSDLTHQEMSAYLQKDGTTVDVYVPSFTATGNRSFRIAFDLLIDNE